MKYETFEIEYSDNNNNNMKLINVFPICRYFYNLSRPIVRTYFPNLLFSENIQNIKTTMKNI